VFCVLCFALISWPRTRKCRVDFLPGRNENKFNLSVSYAFHEVATPRDSNFRRRRRQRKRKRQRRRMSLVLYFVMLVFEFYTARCKWAKVSCRYCCSCYNLVGYHCGDQYDTQHHYLPHTDSRHFLPSLPFSLLPTVCLSVSIPSPILVHMVESFWSPCCPSSVT